MARQAKFGELGEQERGTFRKIIAQFDAEEEVASVALDRLMQFVASRGLTVVEAAEVTFGAKNQEALTALRKEKDDALGKLQAEIDANKQNEAIHAANLRASQDHASKMETYAQSIQDAPCKGCYVHRVLVALGTAPAIIWAYNRFLPDPRSVGFWRWLLQQAVLALLPISLVWADWHLRLYRLERPWFDEAIKRVWADVRAKFSTPEYVEAGYEHGGAPYEIQNIDL